MTPRIVSWLSNGMSDSSLVRAASSHCRDEAATPTYLRGMEGVVAASSSALAERRHPGALTRAPSSRLFWLVGFGVWTALALLGTTQTALSLASRGQAFQWSRLLTWGLF